MKRYLLIAGERYYPRSGTGDWIGTYESKEEIKFLISRKDLGSHDFSYIIKHNPDEAEGLEYDWYDIVDLSLWL